jgi:hypothetical protein
MRLTVDTVVYFIEYDVGAFDSTTVDASLKIPESPYLCGIVDVSQHHAWARAFSKLFVVPLFFWDVLVRSAAEASQMVKPWFFSVYHFIGRFVTACGGRRSLM